MRVPNSLNAPSSAWWLVPSMTSSHEPPSWERPVAWLAVGAIALEVLASVLPRLLVPLAVLAAIFVVVRLVLFHTRKW
jgi:hypothetical protein